MSLNIGGYAYSVKANSHTVCGYAAGMDKACLQKVFAGNVRALRKARRKTQPQIVQLASTKGYTIDQGTISRIEKGKLCPSLDVVEALSKGLDVPAWQLLVPEFDPKDLPVLGEISEENKEVIRKALALVK